MVSHQYIFDQIGMGQQNEANETKRKGLHLPWAGCEAGEEVKRVSSKATEIDEKGITIGR
jgi:hypothetical protein